MALKVIYLDKENEMAITAEKRLYETPDGEIVEELEGAGSLFCTEGTELEGDAAKRYEAFVGRKSVKKKAEPVEDKSTEQAENKGRAKTARKRKRAKVAKVAKEEESFAVETGTVESAVEEATWPKRY